MTQDYETFMGLPENKERAAIVAALASDITIGPKQKSKVVPNRAAKRKAKKRKRK